MSQVLEYLSGNALIRHPFKEGSTLVASAGDAITLSNSFLVDALVAYKLAAPQRTKLTKVTNMAGSSMVELTFVHLDAAGSTVATDTFLVAYNTIALYQTIALESSTAFIKLVPGKSFVEMTTGVVTESDYTDAEFSSAAIILAMPLVTSVAYYNLDNNNQPVLFHTSSGDDVKIMEGTNLQLRKPTTGTSSIWADIQPRAGAGLYDPCQAIPGIKTINGLSPDKNRNFLFTGDDCYVFEPNDNKDGLEIDNICSPKCTSEQLGNFAHYLNRVADGMTDIVGYVGTISTDVTTIIDDYYNQKLVENNTPWFQVKYARTVSPHGCFFYTVTVGVHNPTDATINVTDMKIQILNGIGIQQVGGEDGNTVVTELGDFLTNEATGTSAPTNASIGTAESRVHNFYVEHPSAGDIDFELPCKAQALVTANIILTSSSPVLIVVTVPGFIARGASVLTVPEVTP